MATREALEGFDGNSAFEGAIRFGSQAAMLQAWAKGAEQSLPFTKAFAEDAFGVIFGLDDRDLVTIFWPETGELERLECDLDEFYQSIIDDPDATLNFNLYRDAVRKLGKPTIDEHFAFKIETAVGGPLSVENLIRMNSLEHMFALGKLAIQIRDVPLGSRFVVSRPVSK